MMDKSVERYLRLKYPMEVVEEEEGGYFAHFPDLPGCMAQGETVEEVIRNLEVAKRAWIEVRLEDGLEVPEPREVVGDYSGRFVLRVPKSLHRELASNARSENMSLNSYVLLLLGLALGRKREAARMRGRGQSIARWLHQAEAFPDRPSQETIYLVDVEMSALSASTLVPAYDPAQRSYISLWDPQVWWEQWEESDLQKKVQAGARVMASLIGGKVQG